MHIESVYIRNFRCFGDRGITIELGQDITALIGANGSGKSAFIEALRRLFGITRNERTLTLIDVHFGKDETAEKVDEREIVIDVVFAFPELKDISDDAENTVPHVFRVMTAAGPDEPLKARLRLEAQWKRDESYTDDIDTSIYWVTTMEKVEFGEDKQAGLHKRMVQRSDLSKMRLIYMPANRDGGAVSKEALRLLLRRLDRSGVFSPEQERKIREVSGELQESVNELESVNWVRNRLEENWCKLYRELQLQRPEFSVEVQDISSLIMSLKTRLSPAPEGRYRGIEELSEGQTSLLFLAVSATLSQLEAELAKGTPPPGFTDLDSSSTAMTIYALEEPENHLAPFYLSRMMKLLEELSSGYQAIGLVTSYSPSVLRRIEPDHIRYFRLDSDEFFAYVNRIVLPEDVPEEAKFVRQAVLSQPEIYFANLVILGEGDSEEIVLPAIAKALGEELDPAFVAFAPLGGRHVNHFWRLLHALNIPFLTLLDFDHGRYDAGPLRMKYAFDQLRKIDQAEVPEWVAGDTTDSNYWRQCDNDNLQMWREWFAGKGVFFSYPLDLDMMMISAYEGAYGIVTDDETPDLEKVSKAVFGESGGGLNAYAVLDGDDLPSDNQLIIYDRNFKKRGKPGSHLKALVSLDDETLNHDCPEPLRLLIQSAVRLVNNSTGSDQGEPL